MATKTKKKPAKKKKEISDEEFSEQCHEATKGAAQEIVETFEAGGCKSVLVAIVDPAGNLVIRSFGPPYIIGEILMTAATQLKKDALRARDKGTWDCGDPKCDDCREEKK